MIGPLVARLMTTHAWRSYERLDRVHWTRLAAAITFISFLALFPLITVGRRDRRRAAQHRSSRTSSRTSSPSRCPASPTSSTSTRSSHNAGTVGLIAGALLLFTGIGWVGSMRECLRAVWELDGGRGEPRRAQAQGRRRAASASAAPCSSRSPRSTVASTAVGWTADRLGIAEDGWGGVLLQLAAFAVAVLADFLLLLYVLTLLPGVEPPRRRLVVAALIGAVGFELLKLLLGGYMQGVASKSMYGAFGVPDRAAPVDQLHGEAAAVLRRLDGDAEQRTAGSERERDAAERTPRADGAARAGIRPESGPANPPDGSTGAAAAALAAAASAG